MGKSDQRKTQNNITEKGNQDNERTNTGIADTQSRMAALTPQAADQKNQIWSGYSDLSKGGLVDPSAANRLLTGNYSTIKAPEGSTGNTSGSGGGAGIGGGAAPQSGGPSYLDTYNELRNPTGGFDASRLSNISGASGSLYDTSGNYGDVNSNIDKLSTAERNYGATEKSVSGLQGFAKTGGLDGQQLSDIQRSSLKNIEDTGGYSAGDIANERARSNAGIGASYANMKDTMTRSKLASGQLGPGWSQAGFKLARQSAQDTASQAQQTEANIHDKVTQNKLAAGGKLGDLGLGTASLQSANTLGGYTNAGNLDISKNTSIQDAWNNAGKLGLGRQSQIDSAKEAAAGIDQNTQGIINNTRLGAANGQSQDTLGRMSIGASSGAANAALEAANQRFLISEADANRNAGLGGMLNTYQASPTDLQFNQSLLRGYGQDQANNSQNLIQDRIGASNIPGIGSTIGAGLDVAGKAAGLGAGIFSGMSGMGGAVKPPTGSPSAFSSFLDPNRFQIQGRPTASPSPFQSYGART